MGGGVQRFFLTIVIFPVLVVLDVGKSVSQLSRQEILFA